MAYFGMVLFFASLLCPLAIAVLFVIFIIRAIMKRKKKWLGISAAICGALMLPMFVVGCIMIGADVDFQTEFGTSLETTETTLTTVVPPSETTLRTTPPPPVIQTEPPPATEATTTAPPETTTVTTTTKATTKATTTRPPETTTMEPPVTFEEIYLAYKNNELRADEEYGGNRYIITAEVENISEGWWGYYSVTLSIRAAGRECYLFCTFEKDQREALIEFNEGDQLTFEGTCESWGNWDDCVVVK